MKRRPPASNQSAVVHALLYTRVSGAEHQKEGLSLNAQTQTTRTYAASRPGWVISDEYQDVMSGKRADRPDYQRMLARARQLRHQGERVAIVVVRQDRLGRNKAEYFKTEAELDKLGAAVHSIKDGGVLDATHAGMLAVFAAKEAKDIGARVAEVRSDLVRNGWHYGKVPFGYRKRPATAAERAAGSPKSVLEVDPAQRGVAAEAFERVAAGQSINSVARWMAALPEGVRGGRLWPAQCVTALLCSPTYVARPAEGVEDVLARPAARWEALVSDETWETVQAQIAGHAVRPHQASGRFLLTGFLRCPTCGERMVGSAREREDQVGTIRAEYRCTGWTRGANASVAGCRWAVPMKHADRAVLDRVADVLAAFADPERLPALQRAWSALDVPTTDVSHQLAELEREIQTAQRRLADAAGLLVDGTLDRLGYEVLRDRETVRIQAAETERTRLRSTQQPRATVRQRPSLAHVLEQAQGWRRILLEAGVTEQRAILNGLVDQVTPRRDGYRAYGADITWTPLGEALTSA